MAGEQFGEQFFQSLFPSCHQHKFGSSSSKLPGKLAANASGSAGHQRMTTFESERVRVQFFARTGSSTRQTFSARILCPAAVGWM